MADAKIRIETELDSSGARKGFEDFARSIPKIDLGRGFALGKITGQVSEFQKSLEASNARVLAFSASAGQLYTYVRAFNAILRSTIEVQQAITNLNVIFGLSSKQLDSFTSSLFKVANDTGQSFKIASDAALQFSRQGLGVEETLKRTRDALTLTRLTGLDVAESIRSLTTVINGFNQAGLDSTTILNKLTSVDTSFAISASDLAQALTRVGSIAKDTGVNFDKLLGLITAARVTTGREGSVIATALGTIFQRIERPQVLEQLKQLKVTVEDVNGETLSADKILQNLANTYGDLSQAQKASLVQFAGGVRQGNVLRALMADLAKENSVYTRATNASANATDVARKRQEELNKTLSSQINATVNNFTQAAYRIGQITLAPAASRALNFSNMFAGSANTDLSKQGEDMGKFVGEGILHGIGNYLSGPGLYLGAAVILKFFNNFVSFAAKSLSSIVEIGSDRYQKEQAILDVLSKEQGLFADLNKLGNDNAAIQERILIALQRQAATANARATVVNAIAPNIGASFQDKPFFINNKGALAAHEAAGFIPSMTERFAAHQAGYKPGEVKQMHMPGVGKVTYNSAESVKHFAGLSQPAILPPQHSKAGGAYKSSFQSVHGFNPYGAGGIIPAAGGLFSGTFGVSQEGQIHKFELNQLNESIDNYKFLIDAGLITQKQLNQATTKLADTYLLTQSAMDKIASTLKTNPEFAQKLLGAPNIKSPLLLGQGKPNSNTDFLRTLDAQYAPSLIEANVTRLTKELLGSPRSPFLDENFQKRRVLLTPPPDDFTKEQRRSTFAEQSRLNRISSRLVNPEALSPVKFSPEYEKIISDRQTEISKKVNELKQQRESNTLRDISSGQYGPSDAQFRYQQGIAKLRQQEIENKGFSGNEFLGPDANNLLQFKQQQFASKVGKFGLGGLLNPFAYNNLENQAKNNGQLGDFQSRVSQLQNRAFLASFVTPIVAGVIQQGIQNNLGDTAKGRGFAQTVGGVGNIASFALTGAGIGGPYGALAGGTIGLATELPGIIRAFKDTLPDLERALDALKDSTLKVTTAITNFSTANEQLQQIEAGETEATNGQVNALKAQRALQLFALPPGVRNEVNDLTGKGNFEKVNELLGNFANLTKQQQTSQEALTDVKKKVDSSNSGGFLNTLKAQLSFEGLFGYGGNPAAAGAAITSRNQLSNNLNLQQDIKPFLIEMLGLKNAQGKTLLEGLKPEDFNLIQNAKNFPDKVGAFGTVLGRNGTLGNKLPDFLNGVNGVGGIKGTFNTPDAQNVFNQSLDKIFNLDYINKLIDSGKEVDIGNQKVAKSFSNFAKALIEVEGKFNDFNRSIETSSISNLGFLSAKSRSSEIVEATSNRLALNKAGGNPFLANIFQFQEEQSKIGNQLSESLLKNSNDTREKISDVISKSIIGELQKIREGVITKKETGNINPEEEEDASKKLQTLDKLLDNTGYSKIQGILTNTSGNLTGDNINEIKDVLGKQFDLMDRFRQSIQANPQQVSDLAKDFGLSKDETTSLFGDRADFLNTWNTITQDLEKALNDYTKTNTQASTNAYQAFAVSKTSFEQNKLLNNPAVALSSDQQKIFGAVNENAARTGGNIDFGKTFAAGFQYNQPQFLADSAKNVQEFGHEFTSTLTGAFAEAETSSKKFSQILQDSFLKLAQTMTMKFIGSGLDNLFGNTIGKFAGNLVPSASSALGLSSGGFVGMGSGQKDDVPAMLTGGEYVLNKKATNAMGINNLNRINGYAAGDLVGYQQPSDESYKYSRKPNSYAGATLADSIVSSGSSASINLANTALVGKNKKTQFDVSPLLSTFGQTESNNPQNKLKFAREKSIFNVAMANRKIANARSQINTNQDITLGAAFVSAGINAYSGFNSSSALNNTQQFDYNAGQGPVSDTFANSSPNSAYNQLFPPPSATLGSDDYGKAGINLGQAKGGLIRGMSSGGMFGGDSPTDGSPAMLMGGEYVMKPSTVSKYGANYFNSMNKRYAMGGYVGGSSSNDSGNSQMGDQMAQSVQLLQEISSKLGSNSPLNKNNNTNANSNASNGATSQNPSLTNHVTVNISMNSSSNGGAPTTNSDATGTSSSSANKDRETSRKLAELVKTQMTQTLIEQSKNGGVLWERFQTKR